MRIYLVSPGESELGKLTPNGVWQVKATARYFLSERLNVNRVYVNGNEVSKQSGSILSKTLLVPIVSDERFVELDKEVILGRMDDGEAGNLSYINLFVDEIVDRGKDVAVVIGGGVHRAVISRLTGILLPETRHFSLLSSGISVLQYSLEDKRWRILSLNDRNHLKMP